MPARISHCAAASGGGCCAASSPMRVVAPRHDPRRRALEDVERATFGWIAGTNWIAEAPVPMTATRLPARSCAWSQRAEWKALPSKVLDAGQGGDGGLAQRADRSDEDVGGEGAVARLEAPPLRVVVPGGLAHLVIEAHVRQDAEALGARAQVGPDLGLG